MTKCKLSVDKWVSSTMIKIRFSTNTLYTYGTWTIVGATNLIFINSLDRAVMLNSRLEKWQQ